jgi:hypothetical protein
MTGLGLAARCPVPSLLGPGGEEPEEALWVEIRS